MLTFFAVLVRVSILFSVLPLVGDRFVPGPAKLLMALGVSFILFPALVARGTLVVSDAEIWGSTVYGIAGVIAQEAIVALLVGFTAKIVFDAIHFGGNLVGTFMGFAAASTFDPHQETQSQVVAEIQYALAMLMFLALDGHFIMLKAALQSYQWVSLGHAGIAAAVSFQLTQFTAQMIEFGVLLSAPIALCLFAVNIAFGVMAKALPQLNVLVLSFAISAVVGLAILFIGMPEYQELSATILSKMSEWITLILRAVKNDG